MSDIQAALAVTRLRPWRSFRLGRTVIAVQYTARFALISTRSGRRC